MYRKKTHPLEYSTWCRIRNRVKSEKDSKYYANIKVCERWNKSFTAFMEDMGPRPEDKSSIDRIDGAKDYEPGNCKWANAQEQSWNRSCTRFVTINGETLPYLVMADKLGMKRTTVQNRVSLGWTLMDALTVPVGSVRYYHGKWKACYSDSLANEPVNSLKQVRCRL